MISEFAIEQRVQTLTANAAARWSINEKDCHIGHLLLQAMLQEPNAIHQVDGATGQKETNLSAANRTAQLASAMAKYGLKPGDTVVIIGNNHLDVVIPFYACHLGGYRMCAIDPLGVADLKNLWKCVHPKMIFCQKLCEEKVKEAFRANHDSCEVIIFDDEIANMKSFVNKYGGSAINYRPAIIDQSNATAWLILTSGTTGLPKVSVIPFSTLLNAVICWWVKHTTKLETVLVLSPLQWMSGLLFFIAGPIKSFTRLQSSAPPSPQGLISLINNYKPCGAGFTPYLLARFLEGAENYCDLTCFKFILIGGDILEKGLLEKFKKVCPAQMSVAYGMTELLVPVFEYDENTPSGSSGKPFLDKYKYKLVDPDGHALEKPNEIGELYVQGDAFFRGYLNDEEETRRIITDDGWFKTGDMFYKDKDNYYYFAERKKLFIRHYGFQFSPMHMEEILRRHPDIAGAYVVSILKPECMELPVAAIVRRNGKNVEHQDLFDLLNNNIYPGKKLSTGFFFIENFPTTPSGKIHRSKLKEIAHNTELSVFHRNI